MNPATTLSSRPGPESETETISGRWPPYAAAAVWAFMFTALAVIATSFVIRLAGLPKAINIALAVLPLPGLIAIVYFGIKALRSMDELERRIQTEALALAFGIISAVLVIYGQLQSSGAFSQPERWTMLWPMMWGVYLGCFALVRRKYR